MSKYSPFVSVIVVDYKKDNPYLIECLDALERQTYKKFEIILVADYEVKLSYPRLKTKFYGHYVGPAEKRDEGVKMSKGEIVAFIDDDAYPSPGWLKNLVKPFANPRVAGVGGPGVTPPNVSWREEASGWASASPVGAGWYTYRFLPGRRQYVDDYPSMNLAVRKSDFEKVGGYDSHYWPGEDTKLCLDLTYKLNKKIVYTPAAVVYHHRRPIFEAHLRQNGNYGQHRGFFARVLPQTSLRLIYFLPSLLLLDLAFLFITLFFRGIPEINILHTYSLYSFFIYFFALTLNSIWIFKSSKSFFQTLLSFPVIFVTHLWYGFRFLQGFLFTAKLIR